MGEQYIKSKHMRSQKNWNLFRKAPLIASKLANIKTRKILPPIVTI